MDKMRALRHFFSLKNDSFVEKEDRRIGLKAGKTQI